MPDYDVESTPAQDRPGTELDIYDEAMKSQTDDDVVGEGNLGLGYYSEKEYWMQQRAFHDAMFAGAVGEKIAQLVVHEAKVHLALHGGMAFGDAPTAVENIKPYEKASDDEKNEQVEGTDVTSTKLGVLRRAETIWDELDEDERQDVLERLSGGTDWDSPHKRMLLMRHEASRSKGARLLDNTYGRVSVNEYRGDVGEEDRKKLMNFGGQNGN